MEFKYIFWLVIFFLLPQVVFFVFYRRLALKHWRVFLSVAIVVLAVGWPWDYFGIKEGVWFFPGIMGFWILGLPFEEYLFLISIATLGVCTILFFANRRSKNA